MQSPKEKRKQGRKQSKAMKKKWQDEEYRSERSEIQSNIMKEKWKDPEYASHISELNRQRVQSPEFKASLSSTMTALYNTPEKKAEFSQLRTASLSNGEVYDRHVQMTRETAEQRGSKMRDNWQDPDFCYRVMSARYGEKRAKEYVWEKFGVIK